MWDVIIKSVARQTCVSSFFLLCVQDSTSIFLNIIKTTAGSLGLLLFSRFDSIILFNRFVKFLFSEASALYPFRIKKLYACSNESNVFGSGSRISKARPIHGH